MTILQSAIAQSAGGGGYQISRSLRFNSGDSAFLNRTPASASNRQIWTWSGWVKRSTLDAGDRKLLFSAGASGTDTDHFQISFSNDQLDVTTGATDLRRTTQLFRDVGAFYHFVVAVDTTLATAADRVKVYVNGSQITAFAVSANPTQNLNTAINNNIEHAIGKNTYSGLTNYYDGYMTEINFIDGQQLTPTSFGATDANTGIWNPIAYTGTYGTNGFKLTFSDNSNTTAATLGADTSGNGNNWTPNNFSVTAGAGNDSLVDTPTNYGTDTGVGGEVRGNYATWNTLSASGATGTNGNLDIAVADNGLLTPTTFFLTTGKWYCEIVQNSGANPRIGVTNTAGVGFNVGSTANSWAYLYDGRLFHNNAVGNNTGISVSTGDVLMMALDLDAGYLWYGKNGVWMPQTSGGSVGVPSTGSNPTQSFTANQAMSFAVASGGGTPAWTGNWGQRAFAYTAPSGFKALVTQNLPTPTVGATSSTLAGKNMNVALYTGNGTSSATTQAITGVGFQPDLVWIKNRATGVNHVLMDAVRGTSPILSSNSTDTEAVFDASWRSSYGQLTAFGSDGFTVAAGSVAGGNFNYSGQTYVGWAFKGGNGTVSNTSGTITSTVSANPTAGISVVTYTGNGSSGATFGHGLGAVPKMIIFKCRNTAYQWLTYNVNLGNTSFLTLDSTAAVTTGRGDFLNSTTPSSSLITLGNTAGINESTKLYVAYCFAEVAGFSRFGTYVGNGSTDGPFIYCGFRPEYIMVKRTDSTGDWKIWDAARVAYNVDNLVLWANLSNAEGNQGSQGVDLLSNGVKIRSSDTIENASNGAYIFMAFAESPFNYSRAR